MKLYKATVSFAGKVCMAVNEARRLADKDAAGLLKCGYIKLVETDSSTAETNPEETVSETAASVTETEEKAKDKNK